MQDDNITSLIQEADPKSVGRTVAEIKAAYGVSETTAYAMFVRVAAGCPLEQGIQSAEVVKFPAQRAG